MAFWIFMFACCLLLPATFLFFGWLFERKPPKAINHVYGYRTKRSMKNESTWLFAQTLYGRLSWRWGLAELPAALLGMLAVLGKNDAAVGTAGSILCILLSLPIFIIIWQVERALKQRFDESGQLC